MRLLIEYLKSRFRHSHNSKVAAVFDPEFTGLVSVPLDSEWDVIDARIISTKKSNKSRWMEFG